MIHECHIMVDNYLQCFILPYFEQASHHAHPWHSMPHTQAIIDLHPIKVEPIEDNAKHQHKIYKVTREAKVVPGPVLL